MPHQNGQPNVQRKRVLLSCILSINTDNDDLSLHHWLYNQQGRKDQLVKPPSPIMDYSISRGAFSQLIASLRFSNA